jgi:FkbM family methyltransferase
MDTLLVFGLKRNFRGWFRLLRIVRGENPLPIIRTKTTDGLLWTVDPGSYMDAAVLRRGFYEREILEAILPHLGEGVLWDIGANVGLVAMSAKHLRPNATVVAFEPVPYLASRAMFHAEINRLDVQIAPFALGSEAGYADLSVKLKGNSGLSSLRPWRDVQYETVIRTRVERADRLIEAGIFPCPDVIKIDVEGYEYEVLNGFGEHLTNVKAIIFESDGKQYAEITELLNHLSIREIIPKNYVAAAAPALADDDLRRHLNLESEV